MISSDFLCLLEDYRKNKNSDLTASCKMIRIVVFRDENILDDSRVFEYNT